MAKQSLRAMKLTDSVQHQAICTNCSYSGPLRDTAPKAATDALSHVSKPGNTNHVVTITTITTRTRQFKGSK